MNAELVGQSLSHFQILEKLGQGGMGVVYKALDTRLRRIVAVKVLPPEAIKQPQRRARFLREAYSAAAISHPNIATVFEVGEAGDYVFIAMEYVAGQTLRKLIQDRSLTMDEIIRIARDIARGLAKAHEKGVVHRDIKPDNVMLGADQDVKLLDFGLAKLREAETPSSSDDALAQEETASLLTEEGQLLGSPGYMSPEQAMGRPVDYRTDQFSFGVVLYELVTGKRPFKGHTPGEQIVAICRDEPEPALKLNPALPPRIDQLIRTCMAKQPENRYPSTRQLLAELEFLTRSSVTGSSLPAVSGSLLPVPPTGESKPPRALLRIWPVVVVLAVVGVLAVSLGAIQRYESSAPGALPAASGSSIPEAQQRYAAALRGWHENVGGACKGFAEAIQLDPNFATAHLRLAMCHYTEPARGRESFQKATALRERLSERDQVLLNAYEPIFQRLPADFQEARRRIQRAEERFASDAEVAFLRSGIEAHFDFSAAMAALERALKLDPGFSRAWRLRGEILAYLGSFDEAFRSLERCLEVSPAATSCLNTRIQVYQERGACAEAEADARRWLTVEPNPDAYQYLANALSVRGRRLPSIEEALKQKRARLRNEAERQKEEGWDEVRLALLKGDFTAALEGTRKLQLVVAGNPHEDEHAALAAMQVSIFREIGQEAEAARVAESFLARRDAWEPDPRGEDWAISRDVTARLLAPMRRAGVISREEAERRLAERLTWWNGKVAPHLRNYLWLHFYAAAVATPEEGREAMTALAKYHPVPAYKPFSPGDAYIGQAFLLGGSVEQALPALERMAKSCYALPYPMEYLRNFYFLGQAREARKDTAGACAAYAAVLESWQGASPRSVTAELALSRSKALRCRP